MDPTIVCYVAAGSLWVGRHAELGCTFRFHCNGELVASSSWPHIFRLHSATITSSYGHTFSYTLLSQHINLEHPVVSNTMYARKLADLTVDIG